MLCLSAQSCMDWTPVFNESCRDCHTAVVQPTRIISQLHAALTADKRDKPPARWPADSATYIGAETGGHVPPVIWLGDNIVNVPLQYFACLSLVSGH